MRGHRIMAITSAFQADDAGSIPAARSNIPHVSSYLPTYNSLNKSKSLS